jgi:hypothetical protein
MRQEFDAIRREGEGLTEDENGRYVNRECR